MLDVRFFQNPRFTAANLAVTLTFFAMFGSMFLLTQFLQFVLGYTPLQAGRPVDPASPSMMMIGGPHVGPAGRAVRHRSVVVAGGLIVVAVGLPSPRTATPELGYLARVLPAQLLIGLGIALAMAPATESIMGSLPRDKAGVGSAMNDTTRADRWCPRRRRRRQHLLVRLRTRGHQPPGPSAPAGGGRCGHS